MTIKNYLNDVRNQYEDYPYPHRDPLAEKGLILTSHNASLDCINYYCFEGDKDFGKKFRVLVPGGGTGDCTIFLAEQLRNTNAEIIYLDMSQNSMAVAKERAAVRQLTNITWLHDSILNLPNLDIGKFDFISCTGVLHHLSEPQEGLNALKSVLAEHGSMYLMLYATYGRTGVYQMQNLLRRVNAGVNNVIAKIENTKKILAALPNTNWFAFNRAAFNIEHDSDIYDLLLHSQDRAYTIPELYDFVEGSGLCINKLYNPDHPLGDMLFQPETFISDPVLLQTIQSYTFKEQAAICELLFGQLKKQCCFISFEEKNTPSFENLSLIPCLSMSFSRQSGQLRAAFLGEQLNIELNAMITIKRSVNTAAIWSAMDGQRTIQEIIDLVVAESNQSAIPDQVYKEFKSLFDIMVKIGAMYLRSSKANKSPTIAELELRMHEVYGSADCLQERENYLLKHSASF